jgi:hypothetical protein
MGASDSQSEYEPQSELRIVKLVDGVTERIFGKCENLCRHNGKELHFESIGVKKLSVSSYIFPATIPLRSKRLTHVLEYVLLGSFTSLTFEDDVDSFLPIVATGRQNHVGVRTKVCGLLFIASSREVQRTIRPDGHERCDVRSTIRSNCR